MKKLQKITVFVAVAVFCTFAGAQIPGPIPTPTPSDHYSWALPLADTMSYAKQAVRHVFGYTRAKTTLNSSAHRWIEFEFKSPRRDGVVLARDLNTALATNKFDLIVAESETGFSGNINLSDDRYQTLFNGWFWVNTSGDGGDNVVKVTYYISPEIDIPVPSDLRYVTVSYRDAQGNERTEYLSPQNGWMRIPTNLGNSGTATATFADNSQINFDLANGRAEREERVKVKLVGEFAHTYTFAKGETAIVLGLERWMLDDQGEFTAVFEPSRKAVVLYAAYAETLGAARSVRIRQLPNGVWSESYEITEGVGLEINLPTLGGVWEAVFSFPIQWNSSNGGGGGGYSPTTGEAIQVTPVP